MLTAAVQANPNRDCGVLILTPFERMIAKRYLLPGKSEAFIALDAGISVGVVMLRVAMLVVVMRVMNGFRAELLEKIVGINGHEFVPENEHGRAEVGHTC